MKCPNCGNQIPDDSIYCPDCGKNLVAAQSCPNNPPHTVFNTSSNSGTMYAKQNSDDSRNDSSARIESIKTKIYQIIAYQLSIDSHKINDSGRIEGDYGADSLDAVEILMNIEKEFDIKIEEDFAENSSLLTVGDVVRKVLELLKYRL